MGGDGLALPAGTCSLMYPTTFFAMIYPSLPAGARSRPWLASRDDVAETRCSELLDLRVLQLDRGRTPEDRHRDLETRLLLVDLLDEAVERGERAVADADLLADLE